MSWINDIAQYLETKGITNGYKIFYQDFDASAKNSITLRKKPGYQTKATLKKDMVLKRPELGILVRNADDETADNTAESIEDLLDISYNLILGSTRFKSIRAVAPHFFVSRENGSSTYSINFNLEIG